MMRVFRLCFRRFNPDVWRTRTLHPNKAEKWEREARGELYDAVAERDDFIHHAARCGLAGRDVMLTCVCVWSSDPAPFFHLSIPRLKSQS